MYVYVYVCVHAYVCVCVCACLLRISSSCYHLCAEPMVDSLDEPEEEEIDPEVQFALTSVIGKNSGLDATMSFLEGLRSLAKNRDLISAVLRFLEYCSQVRFLVFGFLSLLWLCAHFLQPKSMSLSCPCPPGSSPRIAAS